MDELDQLIAQTLADAKAARQALLEQRAATIARLEAQRDALQAELDELAALNQGDSDFIAAVDSKAAAIAVVEAPVSVQP
jgi:hypothetical protein